jgi:hypothetical protein
MTLKKLIQILQDHPDVAERTAKFLASEPSTAEMESLMERVHLHLPDGLLEDADRLIPRLGRIREYQVMRLSRAMVLRLAIQEGLEVLRRKADEAERESGRG